MSDPAAIETRALHKVYHDGQRELRILRGVTLKVMPGEAVAIVGASGAGKSTLLHLLAGLDRPTTGEVFLGGRNYASLSETAISRLRSRSIGIIYQFHHLLPEFTALENVMLAAMIAGKTKAQARDESVRRLEETGLGERLSHRPAKLSGGEQQRVALARALINKPDVVLADEPTGNLDAETAAETIDCLWNSTLEKGRALVIVTHEASIARRADRILRLERGKLREVSGAGAKSA
jgi:lipoprotein-releasing system ATP-binding protein